MQMPKDLLERITFNAPKNALEQEPQSIKSISYEKKPCDDCDREIEQPAHEIRTFQNPTRHTRMRCKNCLYTKDPETGEYTVHPSHTNRRFLEYYKQKK